MSYLGRSSEFGVRSRYIYTAAGSETSISGADDNNNSLSFTDGAYVDVYLNGVLLVPAVDYNTTTANTIGGLSALSASDVVEVVVYDVFNVADTVPASTGGTFNGNVTATAFYGDGSNLTGINTYDTATSSTGFFALPSGTTAQRPGSPAAGYVRHNTDYDALETYDGSSWVFVGDQSATYSIEYLVIAGGGSGGDGTAGGAGGAGGYRSSYSNESSGGGTSAETPFLATVGQSYTITIGAGGAAPTGTSGNLGDNGDDSSFGSITSTGGGGGGAEGNTNGLSGGSGGGTSYSAGTAGSGTSGQGYAGGTGVSGSSRWTAGGGGGAGAVGSNAVSTAAGDGGDGVSSSITGSAVYRAGGGGGASQTSGGGTTTAGAGGLGGGGAGARDNTGSDNVDGTDGTANTGGGGGGGPNNNSNRPGNGGSGVVILRMATADYSGTTTGSPTVTTDGTDTILTFTSSGSYTA